MAAATAVVARGRCGGSSVAREGAPAGRRSMSMSVAVWLGVRERQVWRWVRAAWASAHRRLACSPSAASPSARRLVGLAPSLGRPLVLSPSPASFSLSAGRLVGLLASSPSLGRPLGLAPSPASCALSAGRARVGLVPSPGVHVCLPSSRLRVLSPSPGRLSVPSPSPGRRVGVCLLAWRRSSGSASAAAAAWRRVLPRTRDGSAPADGQARQRHDGMQERSRRRRRHGHWHRRAPPHHHQHQHQQQASVPAQSPHCRSPLLLRCEAEPTERHQPSHRLVAPSSSSASVGVRWSPAAGVG